MKSLMLTSLTTTGTTQPPPLLPQPQPTSMITAPSLAAGLAPSLAASLAPSLALHVAKARANPARARANAARAEEREARAGPGDQNPPKGKEVGRDLDPVPRSALGPLPKERSAAPPDLRQKPERGNADLDQDLHHRWRKGARESPNQDLHHRWQKGGRESPNQDLDHWCHRRHRWRKRARERPERPNANRSIRVASPLKSNSRFVTEII